MIKNKHQNLTIYTHSSLDSPLWRITTQNTKVTGYQVKCGLQFKYFISTSEKLAFICLRTFRDKVSYDT